MKNLSKINSIFSKIIIALLLIVLALSCSACKKSRNDVFDYDYSKAQTFGNGGLAVSKGDYVYFVNGYQSSDDMKKRNDSYTLGALMVAKLDAQGNIQIDENGLMKDEYCMVMSDTLAGFEASDLFIFGDYLYFTSPCQEYEEKSHAEDNAVWAKGRVVFNRVHLGKPGKVEKLYTSEVENDKIDFKFYYVDNKPYILVYEQGENDKGDKKDVLYRVDVNKKSTSVVATDVNSVVFDDLSNENDNSNIFFTKKNDLNYQLLRMSVAGEPVVYGVDSSASEIVAKFVSNGYVYVGFTNGSDKDLKRSKIDEQGAFEFVCSGNLENMYMSACTGTVLVVSDNCIEYYMPGDNEIRLLVTDEGATSITYIGEACGSLVYVDNNKAIKTVSFSEPTIKTLATVADMKVDTKELLNCFDLDNNYLYFFNKTGNSMYLNRLQVNNNLGSTQEVLGVYLENDVPTKEED